MRFDMGSDVVTTLARLVDAVDAQMDALAAE
jgi:hypothetical protein